MRKHEAVNLYVTKTKRANKMITVIENWNGNLTLAENAKALMAGKLPNAYQLAKRFELPYRKVRGLKKAVAKVTKPVKAEKPVQEKSPAKELASV